MFHLYFEKSPSRRNIWSFAVGRVARIFPLYYLVVIVAVTMSVLAPFDFISITLEELPAHLIFAQGNSVLWTIAPELVFYMLFAVVWLMVPRKPWLMTIMALAFVLSSNSLPVVWKSYSAEFFVAGLLLYRYSRSDFKFGFHRMPNFLPPILFVCIFAFHLPVIYRKLIDDLPMNGWQTTHYVFMVFFLFVLTFESGWLRQFFQLKIMALAGKISFSIYLLHLLVFHFLLHYDLMGPDILSLTLSMALVFALSGAVFRLYEMPMRLLIRTSFSRKSPVAVSAPNAIDAPLGTRGAGS